MFVCTNAIEIYISTDRHQIWHTLYLFSQITESVKTFSHRKNNEKYLLIFRLPWIPIIVINNYKLILYEHIIDYLFKDHYYDQC